MLAIESSCDDTGAAILIDGKVKSNVLVRQVDHAKYGGVIPELASRSHIKHIVPVVDTAIARAGITKDAITAVAFTQCPGLIGSLMVGACFAKAFALSRNLPLIAVNHLRAHVLAHFIDAQPPFPFLCLTASGGHTQLIVCHSHHDMQLLGQTIDDAAGEAFDKIAKMTGLPYPGGPLVDKYAKNGNPHAFKFATSEMKDYDFSFSGIKTSVLYFLQKQQKTNPQFIEQNLADICASAQHAIVQMLMQKLLKAAKQLGITHLGIAGGVSANSYWRNALIEAGNQRGLTVYIPPFEYCTDNAAMIGITAYYQALNQDWAGLDTVPMAKSTGL
ncbi:MAG: tRNA (adenosine(37)-N6)-threonylcarbamoyltransferase complex transferase subunit TsaD [Chitinophagia bacterium]|nr:tRNA (adenosine(37)-N6)-threonylcarbamoyltransferase complex transferase subunit TsaD [Chitinophagia bacterium]